MHTQQKIEGEQIAIAVYRPLNGKSIELLNIVKEHHSRLDAEGLVTDRKPLILRAADGTLIEIFGWKSVKAIEDAHQNAKVMEMWEEFSAVCTYHPLIDLEESKELFAGFAPVDLVDKYL